MCQYKSEDCPNGCGQKLLLDQVEAHLMNECVLRDVNCKYCHTTVTAKDYEVTTALKRRLLSNLEFSIVIGCRNTCHVMKKDK